MDFHPGSVCRRFPRRISAHKTHCALLCKAQHGGTPVGRSVDSTLAQNDGPAQLQWDSFCDMSAVFLHMGYSAYHIKQIIILPLFVCNKKLKYFQKNPRLSFSRVLYPPHRLPLENIFCQLLIFCKPSRLLKGRPSLCIKLRPAHLSFSPVFSPGGNAAPNVPFSFILIQHRFYLQIQRFIQPGQTLRQILMYRGL